MNGTDGNFNSHRPDSNRFVEQAIINVVTYLKGLQYIITFFFTKECTTYNSGKQAGGQPDGKQHLQHYQR